ncbi:multidrug effflux MFS transporter [soil metagenome]
MKVQKIVTINSLNESSQPSRYIFFSVIIIATIGFFATDSYLPALPAIMQAFHSSSTWVQSTITSYLCGFAFAQLIYGPLSDRHGRRNAILVGFTIAIIGSVLCMLARNIETLILARFIQGIGVAAGAALFRSVLRDVFSGHKFADAAATISTFFAVVPAIAPVLGAYLQQWFGWQANFLFLALYTLFCWLIVYYLMPETNLHLDHRATHFLTVIKNYRALLTSKIFMGHVLCSSMAISTLILYALISPFLFQSVFHLTPVEYGCLGFYIAAGLLFGKLVNKWLLHRMDFLRVMLLGIVINLIVATVLLMTGIFTLLNLAVIMSLIVMLVIGCSFILSNAAAGAFTPFPHIAGTASGLFGCLQVLGAFITGQIASLFHIHNQLPFATMVMILYVIALVGYVFLLKPCDKKV